MTHERFFVLTGGPGSGKSSLIEALASAGYGRTIEAGRAIIQQQLAIDGPALPHKDPSAFAEMMLSWEVRSYHEASALSGIVFFDRGVPDSSPCRWPRSKRGCASCWIDWAEPCNIRALFPVPASCFPPPTFPSNSAPNPCSSRSR
jgi:GTPase SAR1 family protein